MKEERYFDMGKKVIPKEFILVAKFFTKRVLNVEAVARTFQPLWKTKIGFHVQDVGDHFLLFVFEEKSDAKKVLW